MGISLMEHRDLFTGYFCENARQHLSTLQNEEKILFDKTLFNDNVLLWDSVFSNPVKINTYGGLLSYTSKAIEHVLILKSHYEHNAKVRTWYTPWRALDEVTYKGFMQKISDFAEFITEQSSKAALYNAHYQRHRSSHFSEDLNVLVKKYMKTRIEDLDQIEDVSSLLYILTEGKSNDFKGDYEIAPVFLAFLCMDTAVSKIFDTGCVVHIHPHKAWTTFLKNYKTREWGLVSEMSASQKTTWTRRMIRDNWIIPYYLDGRKIGYIFNYKLLK